MLRFGVLLPIVVLLAGCYGSSVARPGSGSHEDLRTPLEKAAQEGNAAAVKRLLDSGADPNDTGGVYGSPLNAAAFGRANAEVIRLLLAAGANPNGRGEEGDGRRWASPLWHAAIGGELESVRMLLDAGASVEQMRSSEPNAAWLETPVADLLVEHGFHLMAVDGQGRNQLHVALAPPVVPRLEGIQYLVRAGVPLNARDHWRKTALDYWREPRHFEIHWIQTWLFERLTGDSHFERRRESRAEISYFLERAGAELRTDGMNGE